MSVLGWILAVCGLVGVLVGFLQMRKMKKMSNVPFRAPSEIGRLGPGAGDAKGMVSTEGQVHMPPQPLVAPMSGQPCLAYEITVERKWEKFEQTENGQQKKTGADKLFTDRKGCIFQIGDGSGAVAVDSSGELDADMEKSHSSRVPVGFTIPGTLGFGHLQLNTPPIHNTEGSTVEFVGTETILKASPTLYALGQVSQSAHGPALGTPKGFGTGKLLLSTRGRAHLLGKTQRNMKLGYSIGGAVFVIGTLLGIFGPAPTPSKDACLATITDGAVDCSARIYDAEGKSFTWTLAAPGHYRITVRQPAVKNPIDSTITVNDAKGAQVAYNDGGSPGADAIIDQEFPAGTYTIVVADFAKRKVSGGYGFRLVIEKKDTLPAASVALSSADMPTKNDKADTDVTPSKAGKAPAKPPTKGPATAKLAAHVEPAAGKPGTPPASSAAVSAKTAPAGAKAQPAQAAAK